MFFTNQEVLNFFQKFLMGNKKEHWFFFQPLGRFKSWLSDAN